MTLGTRDRALLASLFFLAGLQALGFLLESRALRGLAAATCASPLPFVFSAHDGVETFSSRFSVTLLEEEGDHASAHRVEFDSKLYARLRGAYQRRNVYGAIFSHGPLLTRSDEGAAVVDAVARFGLCADGALLKEFGLSHRPRSVTLEADPQDPLAPNWRREVACP